MDITVKYVNESFVFIDTTDSIYLEMRDYFSFFADGYKFHPRYKYGNWSGKIYLLGNNRLLPYGLAKHTLKFAKNFGYSIQIDSEIAEREDIAESKLRTWIDSFNITSKGKKITPHWYQYGAVVEGVQARKCVLNLPTSAGKSLIQALLTKYYLEHYEGDVLILVPTTALTLQMRDDFIDYGLFDESEIDILGGKSKLKGGRRIVISTWQSAIKQSEAWFARFGMLNCDEAHLANGASLTKINQGMINCMYKVGLSGSLKDGKANMMQYIGLFGGIFKPVSTAQLIEEGQVSNLKIKMLFLPYSDAFKSAVKGSSYQEEMKAILLSTARVKFVSNLAIKLAKRGENIFLMFKITKHGKALYDQIKELGYDNVYFVNGDIDTEERNNIKKLTESGAGVIVVASYGVFSTGISVNNLHHVLLAHPVKSSIIVKQTIGRVLRKHGSKDVALVWDIVDDLSSIKTVRSTGAEKRVNVNYTLNHAFERVKIYDEEKFDYTITNVNRIVE